MTANDMRAGFFDFVSVLGAHFHFGYEEYRRMKTSEMLELVSRYTKQLKEQKRAQEKGRRR